MICEACSGTGQKPEPKPIYCYCSHPKADHFKPSPFRDGTCQWMGCKCDLTDPSCRIPKIGITITKVQLA